MINFLKRLFKINRRSKPAHAEKELPNDADFIWCLVGNVIGEHYYGTEKNIKHGTRHFTTNTKVYCFPAKWGDGYEKIKVIGKHRKTFRNVCIVMPSKHITNWRLQKVYRPNILRIMHDRNGWTSSDEDKNAILKMLEWLPEKNGKNGFE